ncbi:helicase-related protein [Apilactobacillus ozensis]|uniref:helicase-related protein n=1 Tax=Apilactobacillus ozensis TaxID=866801 RepID=UPI0034E2408C
MLRVEPYHSEVNDDDRYRIQHQFMNDKIDLVCATSAFGMGIDKTILDMLFIITYPLRLKIICKKLAELDVMVNKALHLCCTKIAILIYHVD